MRSLVSMIIMTVVWHRKTVTLYQMGKIFAIGKVLHVSDNWLVVRHVQMHDGTKRLLAVSRNRIDAFWASETGDRERLQQLGSVAGTVDDEDPDPAIACQPR